MALKIAAIDTAASGTTPLINGVTDKTIRVYGYLLNAAGAVTAILKNGSTALTGAMSLIAGTPQVVPPGGNKIDPLPLFELTTGNAFNLTLGGAVQVSGWVLYDQN